MLSLLAECHYVRLLKFRGFAVLETFWKRKHFGHHTQKSSQLNDVKNEIKSANSVIKVSRFKHQTNGKHDLKGAVHLLNVRNDQSDNGTFQLKKKLTTGIFFVSIFSPFALFLIIKVLFIVRYELILVYNLF